MSPYYRSVRPRFFMSTWLISRHILEVVLYPFSNKKILLNQTRNTRSLPGSCAIETNLKDDSSYFSPVLALNACNCTRSLPVNKQMIGRHILRHTFWSKIHRTRGARRKAQGLPPSMWLRESSAFLSQYTHHTDIIPLQKLGIRPCNC